MTSKHLKKNKLIDKVIPEPLGGIHRDPEMSCNFLKKALIKELKLLQGVSIEELLRERHKKLLGFGRFSE
jgi:acetyl-CoA carboxylase carboxyl transferase subunit alpha